MAAFKSAQALNFGSALFIEEPSASKPKATPKEALNFGSALFIEEGGRTVLRTSGTPSAEFRFSAFH